MIRKLTAIFIDNKAGSMFQANCPLCGKTAQLESDGTNYTQLVVCSSCGKFRIYDGMDDWPDARLRPVLSGMTRWSSDRGKTEVVTPETLNDLLNSAPKSVSAKVQRLLQSLALKSAGKIGTVVSLSNFDFPIAFASDTRGLTTMLSHLQTIGYLSTNVDLRVVLSVPAWDYLDTIRLTNADSKQAFMAMWFDDSMKDASENGFRSAIEASAYSFMRIDRKEHNDKIDDQIIAEIRQSRFIVADFTGNRGGVYFEAGFAKGLGLEVIWTVREDFIDKLHFDIRQFNHIVWKNVPDLRERLEYRILATIGRGTVNPSPTGIVLH